MSELKSLLPVVAAAALLPFAVQAQDMPPVSVPELPVADGETGEGIEEVVVLGRYRSASAQLLDERLNDDSVSDVLGADTISRLGDSNVASALRRVPGLSLVGGRFVYIRGLGERYSSTTR